VPAAALSALGDGTYSVIHLGIGGDGSVVALDQKEVAIGSGNGGAALYYESDNTDWSDLDISKTRKVLTVKDSKATVANANLNVAEIESLSGDGSDAGGEGAANSASAAGDASVRDMNVANAAAIGAEPASTANPFGGVSLTPTTLGYTVIGLIVLGAAGMMLTRNRLR